MPTYENNLLKFNPQAVGKNNLRLTIELRDDLNWSDGTPITGYDFLFSWKVAKATDATYLPIHAYQHIIDVNVDPGQPKKFYIFLSDPYLAFYQLRHLYLVPRHLEEPIWLKARKHFWEYLSQSFYTNEPYKPGLSSGSFVLKSKVSDQHWMFQTNPHSPFRTQISEVSVVVVPLAQWAKMGDFDLISEEYSSLSRMTPDGVQQTKALTNHSLVLGDRNQFEAVIFHMRHDWLKDTQLRKALAHALNKEDLVASQYHNLVMPAWGVIHPQSYLFPVAVEPPEYDQQKSKDILDQLRWKVGTDGWRYKDGQRLTLDFVINEQPQRLKIAEWMANHWKAIGVELRIIVQNDKVFSSQVIEHADYSAMVLATLSYPVNYTLAPILHKDFIPNARNGYRGGNISNFSHSQVSEWTEHLANELRQSEQQAISSKLQSALNEQMPLLPLFYYMRGILVKNHLSQVKLPADFYPVSMWSHEWVLRNQKVL